MNELIRTALAASGDSIDIDGDTGRVRVKDETLLRSHGIDALVYLAVFGAPARQVVARWLIWETAQSLGIHPASIHELYIGRANDRLPHTFTTPAMNLRALSYDIARAAFRAALKAHVGAFMFELSRSEMAYTDQRPAEYTTCVLGAAIKEGYRGPVFLQGDHFQVHARNYIANTDAELSGLRDLIQESIRAGFYNIELDTSTLVDLTRPALEAQQRLNFELCALLSDYIRTHQPPKVDISIGGEIGEVGDKNSDIHELRVFMDSYRQHIRHQPGLSKLSVRVGTSPGGVVLPDGAIAAANVDFARLKELSTAARREYAMGGAVLHGASSLPQSEFHRFVEAGAIELHLATGFQNLLFDHLPGNLATDIYGWLFSRVAGERKPGDTDRQFIYKTRRLANGPFKKQVWNISDFERAEIRRLFEDHFTSLYTALGVNDTAATVANIVATHHIHKRLQDFEVAGAPASAQPARESAGKA
ncbi:MAG: class II fructose-bisphosphate aldolase [Chloroflexi bacterium]|nr:class II fructose-bisphosphate aldolase [Chloroflexota bacterium]MCL5274376.1 class II fructose-bisphosphate aldolase [Chloroflexota bacterium]